MAIGNWVVVIILLVSGIVLFCMGFVWFRQKKLIESLPTSKIRSLAMGIVEVFGEAIPLKDGILKSPFSNKPCVYYKYTIEEYRKSRKNSRWVIVHQDESRKEFFLKDDTGVVLINPIGAEISIPMDNEFNSTLGRDPPQSVMDFLKNSNIRFEGLFGMNRTMRYREYFIAPKDKLYIIGTAKDNPYIEEGSSSKGHEDIMIGADGKEFFYISDRPEKEILKRFRWKVAGGLIGGSALTIGSVAFMMFYLGLL